MKRHFKSMFLVFYISTLISIFTISLYADTTHVAVIDLESQGVDNSVAITLSEKLRSEMVKLGEISVIERTRMNDILFEQGLQQTGCTNTECAIEIGNIIGVSRIIVGSVGIVGDTYLLTARLIDVSTAKILRSAEETYSGKIDNLLVIGISNIARKLNGMSALPYPASHIENISIEGNTTSALPSPPRNLSLQIFINRDPSEKFEVIQSIMTDLSEIDDPKDEVKWKKRAREVGANGIIYRTMPGMKMNDPMYQNYLVELVKRY